MLVENRHIATNEGKGGFGEDMGWKLWKRAMLSRRLMNMAGAGTKEKLVHKLFKNSWGAHRQSLHFPPKTFQQLWKGRNKN